ncbi:thiamine ABC transporter substrate-binding protein [Nocardioides sp. Root140]|uniref:thiamine ABC transporter substrate-binding protein n=1 Tax=Nocardioides sp. Root140 TaxID=1736460 RepID=UPI0006FC479F|nr:thiamine ABC transporter substrate-binding protein [Nocardioides sp. Root140]KQY50237.1 ABC transporter substrate-binding protein [Nocardioides sp. Root140]
MNRALRTTLATITALTLTGAASCTLLADDGDDSGETKIEATDGVDPADAIAGTTVTLVTHDSFNLPKKLIRQFQKDTGATLKIRPSGDAGKLTNALALSQSNPIGDVAFGVDNTFASRAVDEDVFATYAAELPGSAEKLRLDGDAGDKLAPIDQASVCVNVDTAWFEKNDQEPPTSLDDLTDPAYKDLTVIPGAATSSPGLAFLLATIAEYGDDWPDYWTDLVGNGAELTEGWTDAYYGGFTGGGDGDRPIVVSYDTSPAFTVDKKTGETTTAALLDTCFRQVEYAGVLENANNPVGGQAVVDWLLSPEVQAALPDNMYVFPVDDSVALPKEWAKFAQQPTEPYEVSADDISEHRAEWLTEWTDIVSR